MIEKYHNANDGFAGGHFYKEWKALEKRYETIESEKLEDLKSKYYNTTMGAEEQPSLFVVKLERIRIKLNRLGYKIDEESFIKDILVKLPWNSENTRFSRIRHDRQKANKQNPLSAHVRSQT